MATQFDSDDQFRMDDGLDFDFDNISPDSMAVADDRTPTTKVKDGIVQGAKDYVRDPKKVMQFMRTAMPPGYGKAFDLGRESVEEIEGLYNTARETVKPAVNAAKNITSLALPLARGILPKKIYDKLEEFSKPEEQDYVWSRDEEAEANERVAGLIGEVFKAQTELDKQREERELYQEQLAEGVEQIRHKGQMDQLDAIRTAVTSLQNYQDRVTVNYQKRSLELQYRQYWATVESLKSQKETSKVVVENIKAITKNTALPDYAKLTNKEALLEQTRNKFISDVRDSLFGSSKSYVRQFGENARKQITGMLSGFSSGFQLAETMAQSTLGMDMPGMDKEGMVGEEVAKMGLDAISARLGNKVRRGLQKNKIIARLDDRVGYAANNASSEIDDFLTNPNRDWRKFEGLRTILASMAPQRTTDTALELPLLKDMSKARQYNYQDSKTLTEIIPGLLARIHREIRMHRTGEENAPLLTYDFTKNRFTNESDMIKGIRRRFGEGSRVSSELDGIIDKVDKKKSLNEEQRKAMREVLVSRTLNKDDMSARAMTSASTWGGDEKIAELFQRYYRTDKEGRMGKSQAGFRRANEFQNAVQSSVASVGDSFSLIQDMVNLGQFDTLVKSGVVTPDGRISLQAMTKLITGEGLALGEDLTGEIGKTQNKPTVAKSGKTINIDKSRYNFDTSKLEDVIKASNEQLKAMAERTGPSLDPKRVESIDETLLRIEALIQDGLQQQSHYYEQQTQGSDDAGAKKYSSLAMHLFDKGRHAAGSVVRGVGSLGKGLGTAGFNGLRSAARVVSPFTDKVGRAFTRVRRGLGGVLSSDIFVGNEQRARIHASVLRAGGYVDEATGKVITDLSKLKGNIKDLKGNVVLRLEELEDAYVAGDIRRKLTDLIGGGLSLLRQAGSGMLNLVPTAVRTTLSIAKSVRQGLRRILPPYDVYVAGEKKPVLFASAFRMGMYYSAKTGKVIWHPSQIDGEVLDSDGNYVLNEDQIKRGLVDVNGVVVGNPILRGIQRFAKPIGAVLRTVKDLGVGALGYVTSKMKDGARFIKELLTGRIDIGIYSKRTSELLQEIRDFMYSTWGKKKVVGDMNGDGIRDNSLEDMKRKKAKEEGKETKAEGKKDAQQSFLTRMMSTIGGLFEKFRNKKDKEDEDEDDGNSFGLDDAADIADIADAADNARERRKGRKGKKAKKPKSSKRSRIKLGRRTVSKAGKRSAAQALRTVAKKGIVSTALPRLAARVGLGAAGAASTAAAGLIGGTGAIAAATGLALKGVAALASWPAAAAMGVGYLGYLAYKKYKETKVTPLSTMRAAQYGMSVDQEKMAMVKKVFALEQMLQPHVTYDDQGWASVSRDDLDQKELAELFELSSAYQAQRFVKWYEGRFYPVYIRALSKLKQFKVQKPDLWDIESQLEPAAKQKYMDELITECENYHNFLKGPIGYEDLTYDHAGVVALSNEVRVKLKREEKNTTGKTEAFKAPEESESLLRGKSIVEKAQIVAQNPNEYIVKDKQGNVLQNLTQVELAKAIKEGASIRTVVDVPKNVLLNDPTRLDALTCIRYKTYGLKTMVADKVQSLMALEAIAAKHVAITKEGAQFNAKSEEILLKAAPIFGKVNTSGRQAQDWKSWFTARFLPTFLPFVAAVQKLTGSSDFIAAVKKLTPQQQLKLANLLTGSAGVGDNRVAQSVWDCAVSPWLDYEVGLNPDVTANNLETIRTLVAKIELQEPLNLTTAPKDKDLTKAAYAGLRGQTQRDQRTHSSADAKSTQGMLATGDIVGNMPGALGEDPSGAGHAPPKMGEPVKFGSGNGRKWADLPTPTGTGWQAMRELVIEAAKATGVDPKLLAAYIGVESSFDPYKFPKGGKARGLGQHMPGTWNELMASYGAQLGIPAGTPREDARAGALLTAMYLKQNAKQVGKNIGRDITAGEGYLSHFAGPTGASDLLEVLKTNPNAIAAHVRPGAARSNPNVFYDRQTKRPYTVKEMVEKLNEKLERVHTEFGIKPSDFMGGTGATSAQAATTQIPPAQQAQAAGSQVVAKAEPSARHAQAGFANPQAAAQQSARPTPAVSANSVNIDLSVKAKTEPSGPPLPKGDITLYLKREPSTDDGTFGVLQFPDGTSLMTLELPWRDNKTGISCIPAGSYKCKKRATTNFGFAYEVMGVPQRSAILIHAGNSARVSDDGKRPNTQGCILLGLGRGKRGSQRVITSSKKAMEIFYDKMQDREFTLTITAAQGEEMIQQPLENPARGNIERAAAAAPNILPAATAPMVGGGGVQKPEQPQAPAAESGMRAGLQSIRSAMNSGAVLGAPTKPNATGVQLSPSVRPSAAEMAARDKAVLEEMAEHQKSASSYLQKLADSALRREELLRQLLEAQKAQKSTGQASTTGPTKVSAQVDAVPLKTGRSYI